MEISFTERLSARRSAAEDIAACRAMLSENSRTFFAASLLLPGEVRDPATALYAFCRLADDAVDMHGARPDAVAVLQERLERVYSGRPFNHPADRAFSAVVQRFDIPRALPEALLEGFLWDMQSRRYEDISGVFDYAARVAGTVGAMMALLMGARSADALARACDLGVAMQLSNIARDVGEDARAGRLYLPLAWLHEAGIDPERWLAQPGFSPALASVVQRLLTAADELYGRVGAGVIALPKSCQPGINAARVLYAEIGREVEKAGCDSVSRRATVSGSRKVSLLASMLATASATSARDSDIALPPLAECRFLVEAVTHSCAVTKPGVHLTYSTWSLKDRMCWLAELFEKLERQDRSSGGPTPHLTSQRDQGRIGAFQ